MVRPQGAACDIGAFEFMGTIPPRAFDQAVATTGDRPVTIVLKASDPNTGDKLAFIIASLPKSGDLSEGAVKITTGDHILSGDTVAYRARPGFASTDRFEFKVNDGSADSNLATIIVKVNEPVITGMVVLEGMPKPLTGAVVTFSSDAVIARVTSNPEDGSFQVQLPPGPCYVRVEKDGFLTATKMGLVITQDTVLPAITLLWGDANGDGADIKDPVTVAKNLGKTESPFPEVPHRRQ